MAECVVDILELIQVETQNGDRLASLARLGERLLDALVKDRSVGKARERVVVREMPDLPFPALDLRDVRKENNRSLVGALLGHEEPTVIADLAFIHAVWVTVPVHPLEKLSIQGGVELLRIVDQLAAASAKLLLDDVLVACARHRNVPQKRKQLQKAVIPKDQLIVRVEDQHALG